MFSHIRSSTHTPYIIWLVGVSFVLFQFFLQLSSGVIINSIMIEMKLSALTTGILSSSFYYVYTSLQIPAGVLFDKRSTRHLLTFSALACSGACFLFAQSQNLTHLIIGRLMIGAGSSFAFVGIAQILRQHFPLNQFSFMIGLSETLGFLATMFGLLSLGILVEDYGWRVFMQAASGLGLIIAACCWILIPNDKPQSNREKSTTSDNLLVLIRNPIAWVNGLFVALGFTIITVFAAMWAVPFLRIKLDCDLETASQLDALLFLGVALSCPLLGYLTNLLEKRNPLLLGSSLLTALLLFGLLYLPTKDVLYHAILLFLIGLSCGGYMIAYSISNDLAPPDAQSTATGFTNTLATFSPFLQPVVGELIDVLNTLTPGALLQHYQYALSLIPLGLLLSAGLVFWLPEKKSSAHCL